MAPALRLPGPKEMVEAMRTAIGLCRNFTTDDTHELNEDEVSNILNE